jgi:hypothetical protein
MCGYALPAVVFVTRAPACMLSRPRAEAEEQEVILVGHDPDGVVQPFLFARSFHHSTAAMICRSRYAEQPGLASVLVITPGASAQSEFGMYVDLFALPQAFACVFRRAR